MCKMILQICGIVKQKTFLGDVLPTLPTIIFMYWHFALLCARGITDFNPQKKEDRESYLQMFQDYGWKYIQDLNEFGYFCKLDDGTDDEIFSDNQSRIEMLERILERKSIDADDRITELCDTLSIGASVQNMLY